jgi:hypothetical protein
MTQISNDAGARRLRFGVMCTGNTVASWAATSIMRIQERVDSELALFIVDPARPEPSHFRARVRKALLFQANLWHLHNKRFPLRAMPQNAPVDIAARWPGVPARVCATTLRGKWSQLFSDDDVAAIRALDLDFILKFGYGIVRGEILTAAQHGIWSFHHDDEQQFRGGPPAFWEVATGQDVQAAILQRLTERLDGGVILEKIFINTEPLSYRRNLARVLDASTDMPARAAQRLTFRRTERVDAAAVKTNAPIYVAPTDVQMLALGVRLLRNYVHYKRKNQFVERWNIGIVRAPIQRFLDENFVPTVEWAPYDRHGYMIADPFGVPAGAGARVFCEEFSFFSERGWISELAWEPESGWSQPRTILDDGNHMSYPYVLGAGRTMRIMPECGVRPGLTFYRDQPNGLVPDGVMLKDEQLLDATVFEHEGRWWLFATRSAREPNAALLIFHGPTMTGPWTPHAANPVATDVRSSRPAGTPFHHDGRLFRPAQDCSKTYGYRVVINEVTELTPSHFDETPVRVLGPLTQSAYPHGLHTLSACGELTLVDGKSEGVSARMLSYRLRTKVSRRLRRVSEG